MSGTCYPARCTACNKSERTYSISTGSKPKTRSKVAGKQIKTKQVEP